LPAGPLLSWRGLRDYSHAGTGSEPASGEQSRREASRSTTWATTRAGTRSSPAPMAQAGATRPRRPGPAPGSWLRSRSQRRRRASSASFRPRLRRSGGRSPTCGSTA